MSDYRTNDEILAGIERQLIRIAEQGEPTRIVFAKKPAPDVEGLITVIEKIADQAQRASFVQDRSVGIIKATCALIAKDAKAALAAIKPEVDA